MRNGFMGLILGGLVLAGPAWGQTQPPTSEELQRDNQAATQAEANRIDAQNAQLQRQLQEDQIRQAPLFANQPGIASPYYAPPYRPPVPPPPAR